MKKTIKRFWGVGLIVIILCSLFVAPASVSADDNEWMNQSVPGIIPNYQLVAAGTDVADIAVQGNGAVVYAVTGTDNFTYRSTNGGATWARTQATALSNMTPSYIAVAPDNADRIALAQDAGAGNITVMVSVNAGVTFAAISPVTVVAGNSLQTLKGIDISPTRLGANYVTLCGINSAGAGAVFYYNLGAVVGQAWVEKAAPGADSVDAVAYSPNFVSDLTLVALTDNATAANSVALQVYSFASSTWNSADYPNYPVTIVTDTTFTTVIKGSLALDPAYLGGEDSLRNSFIGLNTDFAAIDGIYRVLNTTAKNLASGNIYSVAYDGTTLVAGQQDSTSVLRSLDPMAGTPTVTGTSTYKSPGGTTNVVVAFVGTSVAAGTSGANSAFALSRSSGAGFNDVSLIDTTITDANDVAVSADGKKIYYTTDNGAYTSLWFKTTAWERVLSFASVANYIIRLSPTNPDVVYFAEVDGTRVYYSKDVQSRWYARTATDGGGTFTIHDLAVESDTVAYAMNNGATVIKSTNEGFIWSALPIVTKLTAGWTLVSVKENVLLIGGGTTAANGRVQYSLDGATTWTAITPAIETAGATNVIVIPDENYATNNIIYAATNAVGLNIMQWTVGTSTTWTDIYAGTLPANTGIYGLAMKGGILYALAVDQVLTTSSLLQYIPSVRAWATKEAATYISGPTTELVQLGIDSASPNALEVSGAPNKLWAVKTNLTAQVLYMFTDTLATTPPTLSGPADKTSVSVNPVTGASDVVVFTWNRAGNATAHTVQVAYDSAFTQLIAVAGSPFAFPPTLNVVIGGAGTAIIPGKTYYWRVRASSPINSPYSEVRTFTVQAMAAAVPSISSPANGGTIQSQSPAFSWSPVTGTTKYEFQLSTTPTFGTTVLTDTPASAGTLVPVTIKLEQGKQYFWRVRALEPVMGDWSTAANFIVAAAPTSAPPPVVITQVPAPVITIPAAQPAPTYTLVTPADTTIAPTYIWAIIIIGGILVIAVIVLIVRTRRSV
jgi:hypothetical protein